MAQRKTKTKKRTSPACDPNDRDYVMARLAAARTEAQALLEGIDEILGHFVDPEDDCDGEERTKVFDACDGALGSATEAFAEAHRVWDESDDLDTEEGEQPSDDGDDEDPEDPEDEEEDD